MQLAVIATDFSEVHQLPQKNSANLRPCVCLICLLHLIHTGDSTAITLLTTLLKFELNIYL